MNLLAQKLDQIQQNAMPNSKFPIEQTGSSAKLGGIISTLIPWVFYASVFLLLIYMLLGGLQLMLSRGDPKAVAGAWGKITNAVIGFVIVFLAYFIADIIGQVLGVPTFKGVIP